MRRAPRALAALAAVAALSLAACGGATAQHPMAKSGAAAKVAAAPASVAARAPAGDPHVSEASPEIDAADVVKVDPRAVALGLDVTKFRDHPVGKNLGPLVAAMPQWQELMQGIVDDPVREIDWVYLVGPSLNDTAKDVIVIHHSLSDEAIERAIDKLHQRSTSVVPYDTGVPGVKATFGNFDQGPRVILRAQPHLIVIVPPELAAKAAGVLTTARVKTPEGAGEALRLWLRDPHAAVPYIPRDVVEMTVVVMPREDGGLDASGDGTCADEPAAARAEARVRALLDHFDNFVVRALTRNILGSVKVSHDGAVVHARLAASREQVETVLSFIATYLGTGIDAGHQPTSGGANP